MSASLIHVEIDMRGLQKGMAAAAQFSKRTPAQIANTCAYWVSLNTRNAVPFVTPQKIDSELSVIETPVIGKRGKPLKRKKRYAPSPSKDVPFAALIVAARANPGSYFNRITGGRYKLPQNPFKGVSRSVGRAAMATLIDKMVKARHRSGHFLAASFQKLVKDLLPYSVRKYLPGVDNPSTGNRFYYGGELGHISPAREELVATCTVRNELGEGGKGMARANEALWTYAAPIFQRMVDDEGRKQMEYALKKGGEEFRAQVQPYWK